MPEIRLIVRDEQAETREVAVTGSRFCIGRGADNDLVINDPALSRRHSIVETDGDLVFVTDCGSHNGTFLNGEQISKSAPIRDGDVISIGSCDLTVRVQRTTAQRSSKSTSSPQLSNEASGPKLFTLSGPVVAATAIAVLLVMIAVVFIIVSLKDGKTRRPDDNASNLTVNEDNQNRFQSTANHNESQLGKSRSSVTSAQIEKSATQVIRRISSDENVYVFPSGALDEIATRVNRYGSSSALAGALRALNQRGGEIAASARQEGLEPNLVFYAALAETDGGQRRDPAAAARQMVSALAGLRPNFGCELGDCSLIMLAAYKIDPGTKRSHPLLATMRRLVHNPLTERNVWHLHERGGIDDTTYQFVLDVIAYGIIAQQPEQFGIAGNALTF
ncbi:MAG TPA: FHA domain-containing protein [Blastocatellia bacterium]|nr:FHA domain-containing protein [Blastocatellia bacterium]